MANRKYVDVIVKFTKEGQIRPLKVLWDDGSEFEIEKLQKIDRIASTTGGGNLRYKCIIEGRERYLWFEEFYFNQVIGGRWFVEIE